MDVHKAAVAAAAATFYQALLEAGFYDEAQDFAEWFLEAMDIDLED